ncbi:MAG: D-glycerate dehydrogenase [Alphaproteobacteria bacterium]|nr:D-glycerate dehydrogenase [Alphaproteobacteria bacterium]
MSKPKVVVTRRWPDEVEAELKEHFEVRLNAEDRPMDRAALAEAFASADAVFTTVTDRIDAALLASEPMRARLIGNFGVGFNNIDIQAAKARGLVVTNTPDVLTDATADLAMTLLLAVARRIGEGERHVRSQSWIGWRPTHMMGTQVTGKTLGLIGFGRIGQAMALRAHHGFGMRIRFFDPYPPAGDIIKDVSAERLASIEAVLEASDFVSLHCPATPENRHLINEERLGLMQRHAFLINTARGDVVDEAALNHALKQDTIAGAGLDVFEKEPQVLSGLLARENVVLLPHLGSATRETRIAMGMKVLENARAFFNNTTPPNQVV